MGNEIEMNPTLILLGMAFGTVAAFCGYCIWRCLSVDEEDECDPQMIGYWWLRFLVLILGWAAAAIGWLYWKLPVQPLDEWENYDDEY